MKETIKLILAIVYFAYLKLIDTKARRLVIYYHGLKGSDIVSFRRQMECLASNFTVVKPSEIMTTDIVASKNVVAITFDDAFVSVMKNAVPILKEYGLQAGIFIPAGNLGQKPRWAMPSHCPDKDECVMNKAQIKELCTFGFEIFSHTLSHRKLPEISCEQLEDEVTRSKQILEDIVGREVVAISYPNGAYNDNVVEVAKAANYRYGFTIEPRSVSHGDDHLALPRFSVTPNDSMLKFKLTVHGAYGVIGILENLTGK